MVRGLDEPLEAHLRSLARSQRISLSRAALLLLRRGAGLEEGVKDHDIIGHSLDRFIGDWTDEEARELDQAVSVFGNIDDESRSWR